MNFNQLRAIVKNIRSQIHCPTCDSTYLSEDISVVSAVANRCVLVAQCTQCRMPILVTASLSNVDEPITNEHIVTEHRLLKEIREEDLISSDDVLDMHQFLQGFSGDLKRVVDHRKKADMN